MNFLDPTDITSLNGTSTPPPRSENEQTLNEEVNQVIGQLGRFWGGFRQQSQAAFDTARKDFGGVVDQAQKNLTKLATTDATTSAVDHEEAEKTAVPKDSSEQPTDRSPTPTLPPSSSQTLFSRLQGALPPNVVSTVQSHIPESIKHASEHGVDFNALRTNLQSEFTRVQGITRAQAEEYVHKSESLLREAVKEAQEVLRDAVQVLPPDASSSGAASSSALIWDGADMWMLPSDTSDGTTSSSSKGKGKDTSAMDSQKAVATRAEALLRRLKQDSSIVRHDPEADPAVKELYTQWLTAEVDGKEGGIEGKEWSEKAELVLKESDGGEALKANHDTLVPAELTNETFWKRYFFRVHQIEREEQKRKALLANSHESEDDFSWEDDEEDTSSAVPNPSDQVEKVEKAEKTQSAEHTSSETIKSLGTPSNQSPRQSSEESYDVVSSGNVSTAEKPSKDGSDSDSDWE